MRGRSQGRETEGEPMSIPTILYVVALILASIDQIRAKGQSLTGWACILLAIGLLWGVLR
jgi:hypothetical protein